MGFRRADSRRLERVESAALVGGQLVPLAAARLVNGIPVSPHDLLSMQRSAGNAAVARALSANPDSEIAIQRWQVDSNLPCMDLVEWLNTNSPYAPEWAETRCTFSFHGQARIRHRTLPDGTVESTVSGHRALNVTVSCPIDPPRWSPSGRPNRAAEVRAWRAMLAVLNAHEQEHRRIGREARDDLRERWRAVSITVTGPDRAGNMQQIRDELASQQQQWQADGQARQDAIDPFRGATLTCPTPLAAP